MSGSAPEIPRGLVIARFGLVVGGLVCLAVTPQFATAYYFAHGRGGGETPPPDWISGIGWPSLFSGFDNVSTYNSFGLVFGFGLLVVAVSLGVVVRGRTGKGPWERRAWWMVVGGLGAVAVGSLSEYGIPEDVFDPGNGFALELLGFMVVALGTILLGWAVHRESGVGAVASTGIALIGPVGIVVGTAVIGHLPSGPASFLMVASIILGVTGLASITHT